MSFVDLREGWALVWGLAVEGGLGIKSFFDKGRSWPWEERWLVGRGREAKAEKGRAWVLWDGTLLVFYGLGR